MHPQLQSIADEFHAASARLDRLAHDVPFERWSVRNDPHRWSVGECVAHLNLTGRAYVTELAGGVERALVLQRTLESERTQAPERTQVPERTHVPEPTHVPERKHVPERTHARKLHHRYRRDFLGWLLWRTMGPPVRMRVKTTAAFLPSGQEPPEALTAEFHRLQTRQLEFLTAADNLPLSRVRVVSPFNARVGYNLYSAFSLLPRHQHRHLWQAEQVWKGRA